MTVMVEVQRGREPVPATGDAVKCAAGNAIEDLRDTLAGVAWRIIGDREQARDAVQDVFVAYLTAPEKFSGTSTLKTYLYRMVINRCIDLQRRSRRFRAITDLLSCEHFVAAEDRFMVKDQIRHLLSSIKPLYRVPFVLAEGDGMPYEEIALVLDIPVNTVRSRIFRCREQLRRKILSAGYPL